MPGSAVNGIDDLLGDISPSAPKPPGRPRKSAEAKADTRAARNDRRRQKGRAVPRTLDEAEAAQGGGADDDDGPVVMRSEEFHKPVGVSFLAEVFRTDMRDVKFKLAECPVFRRNPQGRPMYDFKTAAAYLVPPVSADFTSRLRTMSVKDLPPALAPAIRKAMLDEQTWQVRAGNLWRSEDVQTVFGEVFLLFKDTTQLWVETLNDRGDLSGAQWSAMREMVAALQTELHTRLVEMPRERRTPSSREAAEAELEPAEAAVGGDE